MRNSNSSELVNLIASHQTRLRGLVRCLLVRASDAEDVLQDINAVLWEKADEFQLGGENSSPTGLARCPSNRYSSRRSPQMKNSSLANPPIGVNLIKNPTAPRNHPICLFNIAH